MCGVIGASLDNPTKEDLETLKRVFLETEIRGKHASGIAYFDGEKIQKIVEPVPISELMNKIRLIDFVINNKMRLIGHIRYSTSDLKYNQPIGDSEFCIAHNGVISQEDPSKWDKRYTYKTRNDSEILWHCLKNNRDYNKDYPGCSVAVTYINKNGEIGYSRNGLRPLWKANFDNGFIVASTQDILRRSGVPLDRIEKIKPTSKERIHRYGRYESTYF